MPEFNPEDFNARDNAAPWLAAELRREFSPVKAPDALWEKVHLPHLRPTPSRRGSSRYAILAIAAAVFLAASSGLILRANIGHRHAIGESPEAEMQALMSHSAALDFHSADPGEIRGWVKANTNLDVDFPTTQSGVVRLLGVRLGKVCGAPAAVIVYLVGNGAGTLLVTRNHQGATAMDHALLKAGPKNHQPASWSMRDQTYTLAFSQADDPHRACLICHADLAAVAY